MENVDERTAVVRTPDLEARTQPYLLCVTILAGIVLALTLLGSANRAVSHATSASPPTSPPPSGDAATTIVTHTTFLPLVSDGAVPALSVNPQDRQASADFYQQVYLASEGVSAEWTGNHAACDAGTTSDEFRAAVQLRINYFRAMAGVPATIQLLDEYNAKAQQAALMMSVNDELSHDPDPTWLCYTAEGDEAAGKSNLYLGTLGPPAISGYMYDPGDDNSAVGHRRWILYPQTQHMGTGDIPPVGGYRSSNVLWVFDDNMWAPRPATREEYVAWPPPGYVPYQVTFPRWSFSYAGADFSSATVVMTSDGHNILLAVQPVVPRYGENTLVWEPQISLSPAPDTGYTVNVLHVGILGTYRDFTYQVVLFDAGDVQFETLGGEGTILGTPPQLP